MTTEVDRATRPSGSEESSVGPAGLGSPYPLERGKVYVIETDARCSDENVVQIKEALRKYEEAAGCTFLFLHSGLHLVRASSLADQRPPLEQNQVTLRDKT